MIFKPLIMLGLSLPIYTHIDHNYGLNPPIDHNRLNLPYVQTPQPTPNARPKGLDAFGLPDFDDNDDCLKILEQIKGDFKSMDETVDRLEKRQYNKRNPKRK